MNTNSSNITIAIADDNHIFRKGLSGIIENYGNFSIILEADECITVLEALEKGLRPDICIIDITMPDSYQVLKEIKEKWPAIKVLILSQQKNEFSIIRTIKIGANGFLLKGFNKEELQKALLSVYESGSYYSEVLPDQKLSKESILLQLSYREMEFLILCCTELNMKDIAEKMGISVRTIEGYRETLYEKLNVKSRVGLVLFALNIGLMPKNVAI